MGARAVTLAWDRPGGDYTDFQLQYLAAADQLRTLTTDELGITVSAVCGRLHIALTTENFQN